MKTLASLFFLAASLHAAAITTFFDQSTFITSVGSVTITPVNDTKTLVNYYGNSFRFDFNAPITAVGVTIDTTPASCGSGWAFYLQQGATLQDTGAYVGNCPTTYTGFVGFTSTTPFTSLVILAGEFLRAGGLIQETGTVVDLFTPASDHPPSPTPEPTTVLLVAAPLLCMWRFRRR